MRNISELLSHASTFPLFPVFVLSYVNYLLVKQRDINLLIQVNPKHVQVFH